MNALRSFATLCVITAVLVGTREATALGFRLPNQSSEGMTRANAFGATADDPSAVYYNPAGITQLSGVNTAVGGYLIYANARYKGAGGTIETEPAVDLVPHLYGTYTFAEQPFSVGLGLYAPFGLGLEWPERTPFRNSGVEGQLQFITLNPVVAWRMHPAFSIGAGPAVNFSTLHLRQGIGLSPMDELEFKGDGMSAGFNAGALWQAHEQWSFGVNYRSATTMNYGGDSELRPYSAENGTSANVDFPQIVVGGISYRPTTNWNIEVNVDWTDWNTLKTVTLKGTASGDLPFALNWRSSWIYELGVTRYLRNGYFISAGYSFAEQSTSERDFTPLVPDTDLHTGAVGFGYKGERWRWMIGGEVSAGPSRRINEARDPGVNGTYRFFEAALTATIGTQF